MNYSNKYDEAQICLNGHIVNPAIHSRPDMSRDFCVDCGTKTIKKCPKCETPIIGSRVIGRQPIGHLFSLPKFCHNCGEPYPWTEAIIKAARELTQELENITDEEKKILVQSIDDMIKDTPGTMVATTKFKKIISKTGKKFMDAFRDILVDIISETAKKMLWP
ncbi:DUF2321 domain-containing protein [candidate division WOR-3 bacterium]|nr:DUF2321 domain-containing protein [candidate division WOR-3 bacterium]